MSVHFIQAFEESLENQSQATLNLQNLAMELVTTQDPEKVAIAQKILEINKDVSSILAPMTGR